MDFSKSEVFLDLVDEKAYLLLNSFFMVAFSQCAIFHDVILLHASVIEKDGNGYAFLGKSGTGKSTHSALWMKYIEGSSLLNDDNPAVKMKDDGKAYIYGTPWSGKTECYINRNVELKAFVRLSQAPFNKLKKMSGVNSLVTLLPSCSSLRWNDSIYTKLCDTLTCILTSTDVFHLECLPNKEAAEICFKGIID